MSDISDYLEDALLDHVLRNTSYTSPSAVYLGLYTSAPSDAGGGTEVTGGSYARQEITFGASSGGAIANTAAVEFTASGANFGTIVAVGVFDASSSGNLLFHNTITNVTINDGDSINFPIGDIDATLS